MHAPAEPATPIHKHVPAVPSGLAAGLERARHHGLPVSERETMFSTPDDLAELEALFRCLSTCLLQ